MTREMGERIKMLLNERNMSRKELAERTGVTEVAIGRYINGEREPRAVTVSAMAVALGVSLDDLIGVYPDSSDEVGAAVRLIARNAGNLTPGEKKQLINALIGD